MRDLLLRRITEGFILLLHHKCALDPWLAVKWSCIPCHITRADQKSDCGKYDWIVWIQRSTGRNINQWQPAKPVQNHAQRARVLLYKQYGRQQVRCSQDAKKQSKVATVVHVVWLSGCPEPSHCTHVYSVELLRIAAPQFLYLQSGTQCWLS